MKSEATKMWEYRQNSKSCITKRKYTKLHAHGVYLELRRKGKMDEWGGYYHCKRCGAYHITSNLQNFKDMI